MIGPDQIEPIGLKVLATTVTTSTAELRQLGALASADDDTKLSTLTVRVLTDAEHQEIKCMGELLDDD